MKTKQYTIIIKEEEVEVFKVLINCTEEEARKLARLIIEGGYK